jgi:hypothetical protein
MEGPDSGPDSGAALDYSERWTHPALVLLLTIPFSAFISNTFPWGEVFLFATGANTFDFQYAILWQLAVVLLMVFAFYQVGKDIDLPRTYGRLAVSAFLGALIGNLPGFYVYTSRFFGVGWGAGFGYVTSFGIGEPSSIINLFTAAVGAFMIPMAGLALAHFRFQLVSSLDEPGPGSESAVGSALSPFIVSFFIATMALTVASLVRNLLLGGPHTDLPVQNLSKELVPGYIGFLTYPVLLLLAFFFMGRRLDLDYWGLERFERFGLSVFLGGAAGLLVGACLSLWIADSSVSALFDLSNLGNLSESLVLAGVSVLALGFGAASLGFIGKRSQSMLQEGHQRDEPLANITAKAARRAASVIAVPISKRTKIGDWL